MAGVNSNDKYRILLWRHQIWESTVANTGDLAITSNTIYKIRSYFPHAEIHMFSDCPESVQRRYGLVAHSVRTLFNPISMKRILKKMALLIIPGGTILQDNYFIGVIPSNLGIALLAKRLGVKVACIGIGAASDNEITWLGRKLSSYALKRFDVVTVRDEQSRLQILKWTKEAVSAITTSDLAVDIPADDSRALGDALVSEQIDFQRRDYIAIAARKIFHHEKSILNFIPISLRTRLGLMSRLYKTRIVEFKECIAQFCDYVVNRYKVNILFVPFFSRGGGLSTDNTRTPHRIFASADDKFASEIVSRVNNSDSVRILQKNYTPEEIASILGKCKAVVGVPYHSIVLASSRRVPVIAIGYVSKVRRYMEQLSMEEYTVPATIDKGVYLKDIISRFDRLWEQRQIVINRLNEANKRLKKSSLLNIVAINKIICPEADTLTHNA